MPYSSLTNGLNQMVDASSLEDGIIINPPCIVLEGELYSKKNSKQIFRNKYTGKICVLPSPRYIATEPDFLKQLADYKLKQKWRQMECLSKIINKGSIYPINLNIKIYRKTRGEFDYNNITQGLQDILVKAEYLPDDNANYIIPHFVPYEVDKTNPRVILSIKY